MIKQLGILFFMFISIFIYSQESALIGKWKVVEARGTDFHVDVKKDTIIVSDKIKKWYPTKVGMQNEVASIRMNHSHKMFVFTDKNEFYDYLTPNSKAAGFAGNFVIEDKNNLTLSPLRKVF